jgi:hypothetical protein
VWLTRSRNYQHRAKVWAGHSRFQLTLEAQFDAYVLVSRFMQLYDARADATRYAHVRWMQGAVETLIIRPPG